MSQSATPRPLHAAPTEREEQCQERRRYLENILGIPFTATNRVEPLRNGDEIFPAMLEAIRQARHSINFLTYVYWTGHIAEAFADALSERAQAGVTIRTLLDAYGAMKMPNKLVKRMQRAGVEVRWFRPLSTLRLWNYDNRTHRKALICDNDVAFTGGVGIAKEWEGNARNSDEWRETHFRIKGPAVDGINGAFWDNWLEVGDDQAPSTGKAPPPKREEGNTYAMVVRSSSARNNSDVAATLKTLLHLAQERLRITTPYLVLDPTYLEILCNKAKDGVVVEILLPGPYIDKPYERWAASKDFDALLECGVHIRRYQPTMIHTKVILVDDDLACVGSPNFNQRSLRKDDELLLIISDHAIHGQLTQHYEEDCQCAHLMQDTCDFRVSPLKRGIHLLLSPFREQL